MSAISKTKEKVANKLELKEPSKYAVIFFNDDYTPIDFVIAILMKIFQKTPQEANSIANKIHNQGKAVVGIYYHETAEMKVIEVTNIAKEYKYPLRSDMEQV